MQTVFEHFRQHRIDVAQSTLKLYGSVVNQLCKFAGRPVKIDELSADLIIDFMRWKQARGLSDYDCNNARQVLITLWRYGFRRGLVKQVFPENGEVPKMRTVARLPEAWSIPEMRKLTEACARYVPPPRSRHGWDGRHFKALVLTLYDSGFRLRECLTARKEDLRDGWLTIRRNKQRREITRKLAFDTLESIRELPENDSELIFDWPLAMRNLWWHFDRIIEDAGLPSTHRDKFHKLRRTSATHFAVVEGVEAAERHLDHRTPGLALKSYIDPRFLKTAAAADVLPRP